MPSGRRASSRSRLVLRKCSGSFRRSSLPSTRMSKAHSWTSSLCGNDPLTEMLARKIIEIGATGISDPVEISNIVVRKFGDP
jgi:hypothetical protein